MDFFTAIVLGTLAAGTLWVVWAGWLTRKLPIGDVIDKRRNEKWAAQLEVEDHDLPQMIAAANQYRAKRGLPAVTIEQVRGQVYGDLREQILGDAKKQLRAKVTHTRRAREQRGF
jgi:hypothetical protein